MSGSSAQQDLPIEQKAHVPGTAAPVQSASAAPEPASAVAHTQAQPQATAAAVPPASCPTGTSGAVPGEPLSLGSRALHAGAGLLQSFAPLKGIHQHVCGFHMYAHDATRAVRSHHYCCHLNEEMRQCAIYDSDSVGARLIGVEYVISERLFEGLPTEEKKYWHSHKYEVCSGMLVAPRVPRLAEDQEMKSLVGTYGKTWHMWQVDRGDALPLGPAQLMMAYTADGQLDPSLMAARDKDLGVDSAQLKQHRANLVPAVEPHPEADHPWHTGQAYQTAMQQVPFKAHT